MPRKKREEESDSKGELMVEPAQVIDAPRKMRLPPIPPPSSPAGSTARTAHEIRKRISDGELITDEQRDWLEMFERMHPIGGARAVYAKRVRRKEEEEVDELAVGNQGPQYLAEREAGKRLDSIIREMAEDRRTSRELLTEAFKFSMEVNRSLRDGLESFMGWHREGWQAVNTAQEQALKLSIAKTKAEIDHAREVAAMQAEADAAGDAPFGIPQDVWEEIIKHARVALPEIGPALPALAGIVAKKIMGLTGGGSGG